MAQVSTTESTALQNDYQRIDVRPLTGAMGAKIHGVDLSKPLDDTTYNEIQRALVEHLAIFFRDQDLTPAQYVAFGRRFGTMDPHPLIKGMPGQPEILEIIREKTDRHIFAEGWHSDVSWKERPVVGTMLYGVEIPDVGGDTLFANQYLAYEGLSDAMKRMLAGVKAVHSAGMAYSSRELAERTSYPDKMMVDLKVAAQGQCAHPIVRTHPVTGRKALYVSEGWTSHIEGMTPKESAPLLNFLYAHSTRPEYCCRFRWHNKSLAFWDNRIAMHTPIDDYFGKRRHLWRITLGGERPY
jgi:taurine dioxygenase